MRETSATVGHWTFGEGVGTTIQDSSGNARTATFGAGGLAPAWVSTGRLKYAVSFDGVDDVISITHATPLNPAVITVMAWVNQSAAGNYPAYVTKYASGSNRWELIGNSISGKPEFLISNVNGTVEAVGTTIMQNAGWTFVVGTFDGITARIYVNGVQEGTAALAGNLDTNTADVGIGNRPSTGVPYPGQIDDVQIRNVVMTAAQILEEFELLPSVTCYA